MYSPPPTKVPNIIPPSSVLISRIVLAAGAATIDLPNIPQTFENLIVRALLKSTLGGGGGADTVIVRMNGDGSTANYNDVSTSAAAVSASGAVGPTGQNNNFVNGAACFDCSSSVVSPATAASYGSLWIPKYARTNFRKLFTVLDSTDNGADFAVSGRPQVTVSARGGVWASTAAIVRLTFVLNSAANFAAGSVLELYGES